MRNVTEMEKRIRFLTAITEGMLSSVDLDEIIYVILSGITSGDGMGYNRAFLFLLDEHRRSVTCRMAVGPSGRLEAHRIWEEMEEKRIDLRSLIAGFRRIKGDPRAWSLTKAVSSFSMAGRKIGAGVRRRRDLPRGGLSLRTLVNLCMSHRLSFADNRCRIRFRAGGSAPPLVFRRFVVVPLVYRRETVGAVLADNIYGDTDVRKNDIRALRDVANLAALAIERARLYEEMKRLAEIDGLTGLLNRRRYCSSRAPAAVSPCRSSS
jgi:GAF domain-containing protein